MSLILGTVTSWSNGNGATVKIDGESAGTTKRYLWLSSYKPASGDRVLIAEIGDEYVVLGKVTTDTTSSALSYNNSNRINNADDGYVALGIKNGDLYFGLVPKDGSSFTLYKLQKAS